ncbi:MAG TPA: septal ring lytic transglycosylase RlpA family protein [Candidatus Binataceae bacterium]|nr:septal ring lytic transglycosylase RlpA family protein [Candidatus Binataceae bacterium]
MALGTGCANQNALPQPTVPVVAPPPAPSPPISTGSNITHPAIVQSKTVKASYQGAATAGHVTSSGEPYDPNALTAASRTLPIGSTVKVTNPSTGRAVKVRINDRGPFVHGRSLDLSKHAAEKIGLTHKGVARVKVTPLNSHTKTAESQTSSSSETPVADKNTAGTSQDPAAEQ